MDDQQIIQPQMLPEVVEHDFWIYRIVVGALALVALATVLGGVVLAGLSVELPGAVIALGSAAIGALAGLLAPAPR